MNANTTCNHGSDLVRTFSRITANDHGSMTPVEELITNMVAAYEHAPSALTPTRVQRMVDEFRQTFEEATRDARRFAQQYPEMMAEQVGVDR